MMLTSRQLLILQLTVNDFIESAHPVGSRQLSKKPEAPFSPATIRNEMADLEDMGLLEKTHTSSGRIPSEKGYRFYVDHLLKPERLNEREKSFVRSLFDEHMIASESIIQKTADVLSELTNYTSILLGPNTAKHRVKKFEIVPLNQQVAVAIVVTDRGRVENRMFQVPEHLHVSDIEKLVNILNEQLVGTPLNQVQQKLRTEVDEILTAHIQEAELLLQSLYQAMHIEEDHQLFFGGKFNMMKQPEFHDVDQVELLFDVIDDASTSLLFRDGEGVNVRIGSENDHDAMENCSIITANYALGGDSIGSLAIIGPTRMDYSRTIAILDVMSRYLSKELSQRMYGEVLTRRNES